MSIEWRLRLPFFIGFSLLFPVNDVKITGMKLLSLRKSVHDRKERITNNKYRI